MLCCHITDSIGHLACCIWIFIRYYDRYNTAVCRSIYRQFAKQLLIGNIKIQLCNYPFKNGTALAALLPDFRLAAEHGLTEGMAVFVPIYKVLDKLTVVRNISNKIIVMEKR